MGGLVDAVFGGGDDPPPPPDYTPVAQASKEAAEISAQLGREQLAEARRQYEQNMAIARPTVDAQLDIMRQTAEQGRDYYEYSKTFRPLEQRMLTQAYGGMTPRDLVRFGVTGAPMADTVRRVSNFIPSRGASGGGPGTMNNAWDAYWQAIKPGQTMDFAGGKLTRNQDGSATYTNASGRAYTYDRETPFSEVARMNPEIAQSWQRDFAYRPAPSPSQPPPPAPPQPAPQQAATPVQGEAAAPDVPLLRFASANQRQRMAPRFPSHGVLGYFG